MHNGFENPQRKAEGALEEAIKSRSSLSCYNYLYYSWKTDANKAIESANSLLERMLKNIKKNLMPKWFKQIKNFKS
ncbi:hypothetical protein [Borreliella burgdorferi]|nr:hypothetical protein [Borreliella burgdorferi]MCD2386243.1 hypothetical protein [Borreliella burgdorferi]MCD2387506.1 hypothetical protein [Borreliella burgdorferi]MCD2390440.1 hypothetical protein [Borreliella burgdorferi]PRR32133.1 hypothetical protein CV693_05755 [Borreliella burgdorferi]PRR35458.1 hypothetical protein CV687_05925 [Borreliella burgdorferi]